MAEGEALLRLRLNGEGVVAELLDPGEDLAGVGATGPPDAGSLIRVHTLELLTQQAQPDPADAATLAARLPLIHVWNPPRGEFISLLKTRRLGIPLDAAVDRQKTAAAEAVLGLGPHTYLYAGRCFTERPVGVAVVYDDLDELAEAAAEASPFDTGGLVATDSQGKPHIDFQWRTLCGHQSLADYLHAHTCPLKSYPLYLAAFLQIFFDRPSSYFTGPNQPIDGVDLDKLNKPEEWRHWTFEIRSPGPVAATTARWGFTGDYTLLYAEAVAEGAAHVPPKKRIRPGSTSLPDFLENEARAAMVDADP